jgi:hypothetical protein
MIVTPRVGSSYYQATTPVNTSILFQADVRNNGDVPLQTIALLTTPSGWELLEQYDNCPDALHVGAVCTFTWKFIPRVTGSVLLRVYARGFYTDPYGSTQRVTKSPGYVINVY